MSEARFDSEWGYQFCMSYKQKHNKLLKSIKKKLPELKKLWVEVNDGWGYEDFIYRFYHQSFKTYMKQDVTIKIVGELKKLSKEPMNEWFLKIIKEGTTQKFSYKKSNKNWLKENRPQLEAFFHAKHMLEMVIKYGEKFDETPDVLPSGWASVLYLYNLR